MSFSCSVWKLDALGGGMCADWGSNVGCLEMCDWIYIQGCLVGEARGMEECKPGRELD